MQLETISNSNVSNRNVVEHSSPSSTGVFQVDWTAPENTGDVTFYFSGIAANGNGSNSGDTYGGGTFVISPLIEEVETCLGDFNGDLIVSATDLTLFLSVFGVECN